MNTFGSICIILQRASWPWVPVKGRNYSLFISPRDFVVFLNRIFKLSFLACPTRNVVGGKREIGKRVKLLVTCLTCFCWRFFAFSCCVLTSQRPSDTFPLLHESKPPCRSSLFTFSNSPHPSGSYNIIVASLAMYDLSLAILGLTVRGPAMVVEGYFDHQIMDTICQVFMLFSFLFIMFLLLFSSLLPHSLSVLFLIRPISYPSHSLSVPFRIRPIPDPSHSLSVPSLIRPISYPSRSFFVIFLIRPIPYSSYPLSVWFLIRPIINPSHSLSIPFLIHPTLYLSQSLSVPFLIHPIPYPSHSLSVPFLIRPILYPSHSLSILFLIRQCGMTNSWRR